MQGNKILISAGISLTLFMTGVSAQAHGDLKLNLSILENAPEDATFTMSNNGDGTTGIAYTQTNLTVDITFDNKLLQIMRNASVPLSQDLFETLRPIEGNGKPHEFQNGLSPHPFENWALNLMKATNLNNERCGNCSFSGNMKLTYSKPPFLSIIAEYSNFWATAHPWPDSTNFTYDIKTSKRLTFGDLFNEADIDNVRAEIFDQFDAQFTKLLGDLEDDDSLKTNQDWITEQIEKARRREIQNEWPALLDNDKNGKVDHLYKWRMVWAGYVNDYKFENFEFDTTPLLPFLKPEYRDSFE